MKIRLIWDDCTPALNRRPITVKDIENDIHIEELESEEELINTLADLCNEEPDDFEGDSNEETIQNALSVLSDPGDGSPNILYLSIDDATLVDDIYDTGLDGATCTEDDIIETLIAQLDLEEEPEDDAPWYNDEDELDEDVELNEASSAETKAFKNGGEDLDDLVQGRAIARIKDPKARDAAIAAAKAGRKDVVKQFTGDRKDQQALNAYEKKAQAMANAGVNEDLDAEDDIDLDNDILRGPEASLNALANLISDAEPEFINNLSLKLGVGDSFEIITINDNNIKLEGFDEIDNQHISSTFINWVDFFKNWAVNDDWFIGLTEQDFENLDVIADWPVTECIKEQVEKTEEELVKEQLSEKDNKAISEYRKLIACDEDYKITPENLEENDWAVKRVSCYQNYDYDNLKELLLK